MEQIINSRPGASWNPIDTLDLWFGHSPSEHLDGLYTGDTNPSQSVSDAAYGAASDVVDNHSFGIGLSGDAMALPFILDIEVDVIECRINPFTGEYVITAFGGHGGVGFGVSVGADIEFSYSPNGSPSDVAFGAGVYAELDTPYGDFGWEGGSTGTHDWDNYYYGRPIGGGGIGGISIGGTPAGSLGGAALSHREVHFRDP